MALAAQVVAQERYRRGHVHDQHVEIAVIVEISEGSAAAGPDLL